MRVKRHLLILISAIFTIKPLVIRGANDKEPKPLPVNPRFRPNYHFAPPYGWMNDPNGFSTFRSEYHLFYQFNPFSSSDPGIVHWGHTKSPDLLHWEFLPVAMNPDEFYDRGGVFSGSAVVHDDIYYLYYTGNINLNGTPTHEQHQNLAISYDGVTFHKYEYNPIIYGASMQPDLRDPKVWRHNDNWYMVLGNSINNVRGRAVLYGSHDLYSWKLLTVLAESDGSIGYMWECPDFFELDGKFVLLFSPQGIKPQGDRFNNLYQTGYIIGKFNYDNYKFAIESDFKELDFGHDFYASQTLELRNNRVMIAWMDMWEKVYPERQDGWSGAMTLPRKLNINENNVITMNPIDDINTLRSKNSYSGKVEPGEQYTLNGHSTEIYLISNNTKFIGLYFDFGKESTLSLEYKNGYAILDRGGSDGIRRTEWHPADVIMWRVYLDGSSVEWFCGMGEVVFTSRIFPVGDIKVTFQGDINSVDIHLYDLKQSVQPPPLIQN